MYLNRSRTRKFNSITRRTLMKKVPKKKSKIGKSIEKTKKKITFFKTPRKQMSRSKLMYFILDQYLKGNDNFKFPNTTTSELLIDVSGSRGRTI